MSNKGNLFVISAPSGSGKTSLASSIIHQVPNLEFSISHTTRKPRAGETDGVEYYFVGEPEFKKMVDEDAFLEWAPVYGNYYGTSRTFVGLRRASGCDVLLDIDVQGARKVQLQEPAATMIFVLPPSYQVLEKRLQKRGSDNSRVIESRLEFAREEINCHKEYDYLVLNDDMDLAIDELKSVIASVRCRHDRRIKLAEQIVSSFERPDSERNKL
jgi:guanylate kinase